MYSKVITIDEVILVSIYDPKSRRTRVMERAKVLQMRGIEFTGKKFNGYDLYVQGSMAHKAHFIREVMPTQKHIR